MKNLSAYQMSLLGVGIVASVIFASLSLTHGVGYGYLLAISTLMFSCGHALHLWNPGRISKIFLNLMILSGLFLLIFSMSKSPEACGLGYITMLIINGSVPPAHLRQETSSDRVANTN